MPSEVNFRYVNLLQSLDLKPECFAPFLPTAVSELIRLLGEADTFESKRRIDHSLNVLIERSGDRVAALYASPRITYRLSLDCSICGYDC